MSLWYERPLATALKEVKMFKQIFIILFAVDCKWLRTYFGHLADHRRLFARPLRPAENSTGWAGRFWAYVRGVRPGSVDYLAGWQPYAAGSGRGIAGARLAGDDPGGLYRRPGTWPGHWPLVGLVRDYNRNWPAAGRLAGRQPVIEDFKSIEPAAL